MESEGAKLKKSQYEKDLLILLGYIIGNYDDYPFDKNGIMSLLDEFCLLKIIEEIEPEIYTMAGIEEIQLTEYDEQDDLNAKSENFSKIFKCLTHYFKNSLFINKFKFSMDSLQLKELIKSQPSTNHVIILCEFLIILSAVSTNKDNYFRNINASEDHMKIYYDIASKYISLSSDPETVLRFSLSADFQKRTTIFRRLTPGAGEKEKIKLLLQIDNLERVVSSLQKQNRELTDTLIEIEEKYQEVKQDNEIMYEKLKTEKSSGYSAQDMEELGESLKTLHLQNELNKKELEIEEIKKDHEMEIKKQKTELRKINEEKDILEDNLNNLRAVQFENEKLKIKIKEMLMNKDKLAEFDSIKDQLEKRNFKITALLKERDALVAQNQNLMKENLEEKHRTKEIQIELKKVENENQEIKRELSYKERTTFGRLRNQTNTLAFVREKEGLSVHAQGSSGGYRLDNLHMAEFDDKIKNYNKASLDEPQAQNNYFDDNNLPINPQPISSFRHNQSSPVDEENISQEIFELQSQLNNLNQRYQNELSTNKKLLDEISELKSTNQKLTFTIDNMENEKDQMVNEKEKGEVMKTKLELNCEKILLEKEKLENEKKNLTEEILRFKERIDYLNKSNSATLKELENMKVVLSKKNNQVEKILSEKQMIVNDLQNLQVKYEKSNINNNVNAQSKSRGSRSSNSEYQIDRGDKEQSAHKDAGHPGNVDLKSEISKLKSLLLARDESIKQLKERVKHLEKVEILMKNNQKEDCAEMYKKSYEEQKLRINQEHEMLTNSLYDLALQFVTYKNELLKSIKPSIVQANNINR